MRKKLYLTASLAVALLAGAGVASMNVQAETDWADFKIVATSVRLGDGTKEDPTGLRFMINCPVDYSENEAVEAYTTLTLTPAGKTETSANVEATVWRTDKSGWNTVLLEIPATDYQTDVTATAYVVVDGETKQSNTVTYSVAKHRPCTCKNIT